MSQILQNSTRNQSIFNNNRFADLQRRELVPNVSRKTTMISLRRSVALENMFRDARKGWSSTRIFPADRRRRRRREPTAFRILDLLGLSLRKNQRATIVSDDVFVF